jgi:glycosyltransferase involved in cell wall biosynthesis
MFLLSFVEQFAVQKLDYTVAVSSYLKNLIIRNYKTPHRKVHLLYQAVDVDKILFKTVPSDMTMPVKILFVKNRFTLGGLPEIPEALSLLKEFNFHLDIAGPENLHLAEIEQMFKDVPNVSIRFWGPVPQDTIHQLMKSSHLLCHPARRDALPLTVIEALAHGLPVVSTTVGGIPEILDNGINGWLCEANNPYTLAEALKNCINASPKEQLNKSLRGRAFVEKTFNYPVMLENLLEILESAIEKKSLHAQ